MLRFKIENRRVVGTIIPENCQSEILAILSNLSKVQE